MTQYQIVTDRNLYTGCSDIQADLCLNDNFLQETVVMGQRPKEERLEYHLEKSGYIECKIAARRIFLVLFLHSSAR